MEKNLFGNHPVSLPVTESRSPPPAFSSDPLINRENNSIPDSAEGYPATGSRILATDIVEIDGPNSAGNFLKGSSPGVREFCSPLWHVTMRCFCTCILLLHLSVLLISSHYV